MKRSSPPLMSPVKQPTGFILVAVMLLIALVTILVVTSAFLARIERRAQYNAARQEVARQNALFGLNAALSQLQKQAGLDQSITARADILDSNPATPAVDGFVTPSQAYWTGVWKTGKAPLDINANGTTQRATSLGGSPTSPGLPQSTTQKVASASWLVSDPINPSTNLPLALDPTAALPNTIKTVALAKNLPDLSQTSATPSSTPGPTVTVSAPLVPIFPSATAAAASSPAPVGKYAYWVSDEGIKAKVNLPDPTYGAPASGINANTNSNFVENQLHFLAPQGTAVQTGLLGSGNVTDIRDPAYKGDIPKVTTLQSLGYVGGTTGNPAITGVSGARAASYSPDATTYSYGVLADVRNGGLKIDLSQAFETPTQFSSFLASIHPTQPTEVVGDEKVWSVIAPSFDTGNAQTPAEFGTRWQSLYNYYSMYKNSVPSSAQSGAGSCPWNNINYYSGGTPGTPTPQVDTRVFNYTSNPNGSASPNQEIGEYYMPHILGYGVYF